MARVPLERAPAIARFDRRVARVRATLTSTVQSCLALTRRGELYRGVYANTLSRSEITAAAAAGQNLPIVSSVVRHACNVDLLPLRHQK